MPQREEKYNKTKKKPPKSPTKKETLLEASCIAKKSFYDNPIMPEKAQQKPFQPKCSCCKTGNLVTIAMFDLRGPPRWFLEMSQSQPTPKK